MTDDLERRMQFEWLRSEQDLANERLSAYTEADQKIIAVMGTVVAALIGLSTAKVTDVSPIVTAYVLLLSALLMCLAVNQSSLYSSLALIYLERKVDLANRMGVFLGCDADFASSQRGVAKAESLKSYAHGVRPYLFLKLTIAPLLTISSVLYSHRAWHQLPFKLLFAFCLGLSIWVAFAVAAHYVDFASFVGRHRGTPADGSGRGADGNPHEPDPTHDGGSGSSDLNVALDSARHEEDGHSPKTLTQPKPRPELNEVESMT